MNPFSYVMTQDVEKSIEDIEAEGLKKKTKKYLVLLEEKGYNLPSQYMDKIEGYRGLFELKPHFGNIEFRLLFYWKGSEAQIIHWLYERGNTKKNRREYETAERIRNSIERR